jgi:putative transcriptional regulator
MKTDLGKGVFLVASPSLRDPNFRQTVVLLCEHGAEGALGVVVNRPTAMQLTEALPHMPVLEAQGHTLFAGGPVQPGSYTVRGLASVADPDGRGYVTVGTGHELVVTP